MGVFLFLAASTEEKYMKQNHILFFFWFVSPYFYFSGSQKSKIARYFFSWWLTSEKRYGICISFNSFETKGYILTTTWFYSFCYVIWQTGSFRKKNRNTRASILHENSTKKKKGTTRYFDKNVVISSKQSAKIDVFLCEQLEWIRLSAHIVWQLETRHHRSTPS